jgi:hypothetical protein
VASLRKARDNRQIDVGRPKVSGGSFYVTMNILDKERIAGS